MAVATTVRRPTFNDNYLSTLNLSLNSTSGVSAGMPLTIAGDLVLTTIHERPNNVWKCEVTGTPRGSARLIVRMGDIVTG